ncbi:efflux RND transporter periplasmic adaptor subunit [Chlorobium phaeobacteroides]|jgi:multidrug efflux pump subunit AcrA (membrane-fusion protein)|uniref:Efflux transporter, RND family, MFP subunit n=1 Tax=Chlorobium phaeobacteroides (strain DSM 266 / SMG 266 / 2430) TaxID=290317 RepID=A1BCX2_CHLPD|nr:hypothetical protein [Chlorobium phaeobacteroides]ABL64249.1 conserved hypothetical protein [Chlorobium phaeobacteroides DSM 266]MBV5319614.1 hypothetical protein [Chlorobium phaeobacteroides]
MKGQNNSVAFIAVLITLLAGCGKGEQHTNNAKTKPDQALSLPLFQTESTLNARGEEVILVPKSSVFQQGGLTGVFVVGDDQKATIRWIRTGRIDHGSVVVLGGIDKGEMVIANYNPELKEGVSVTKSQAVTREATSNE